MDDATKTYLLNKVNEMERSGLAYQQHGAHYKNPHYDVSFVLKNLCSLDALLFRFIPMPKLFNLPHEL